MKSILVSPLFCAIIFTCTILVTGFVLDFEPPVSNSAGMLLSIMVITGSILMAGHVFARPLSIPWKLRVLSAASVLSVIFFALYLSVYADKVIDLPPRVVIGSEFQKGARAYIDSEIADGRPEPSHRQLLDSTGGEFSIEERLERIWTRTSIRSSRIGIVVLWAASFVALGISILFGFEFCLPFATTPGSVRHQLDGKKLGAVYRALIDAYDGPRLERMVRERMNERLDTIVAPGALSARVSELILWANREGRIDELIEAACDEVPQNAWIRKLAVEFGKPK